MTENAVIGVDFGTESVRAVIVDAADGGFLAMSEASYPRWQKGLYCNPKTNRFRQHPSDFLECLEKTITQALASAGNKISAKIRGIAVDTTGSTPVAVNRKGTPLALISKFREDPDAMFILWKDHTAVSEAEKITETAKNWRGTDFTRYVGGTYSSEWFWAKMLHILKTNPKVREAAFSWVEHCDWMTGVLTGNTDPLTMKRSRCAAGHKAMWHQEFQGLPQDRFLTSVDPLLKGSREKLFTKTHTGVTPAGTLCPEWAEKLGLKKNVIIAVGMIDAHTGAVGGQITPGAMLKVMGTSTCDMIVAPEAVVGKRMIRGICGQVSGSIIPGLVGMEAGQSAFGDLYAWFRDLLLWPAKVILEPLGTLNETDINKLAAGIIPELARAAAAIPPEESAPVALDWMNGRRTPNANQNLKGGITGLTIGTTPPLIFASLVEATAFGSRRIAEQFRDEGIEIREVIAVGGVAKKSPYVMQVVADVMNMEIKVARSEQTSALGAAMLATVAAGIHDTLPRAQESMGAGFETRYVPDPVRVEIYNTLYKRYLSFGEHVEKSTPHV